MLYSLEELNAVLVAVTSGILTSEEAHEYVNELTDMPGIGKAIVDCSIERFKRASPDSKGTQNAQRINELIAIAAKGAGFESKENGASKPLSIAERVAAKNAEMALTVKPAPVALPVTVSKVKYVKDSWGEKVNFSLTTGDKRTGYILEADGTLKVFPAGKGQRPSEYLGYPSEILTAKVRKAIKAGITEQAQKVLASCEWSSLC